MTHYPDGSPYSYLAEAAEPGTVNIGWLDRSHPFPQGDAPAGFADALIDRCRRPVNRTRGLHHCNLCDRPAVQQFVPPAPTVVPTPDGDLAVGGAEIRVTGADGTRYAAPDMVCHYVVAHRYLPPQPFIDAVVDPGP